MGMGFAPLTSWTRRPLLARRLAYLVGPRRASASDRAGQESGLTGCALRQDVYLFEETGIGEGCGKMPSYLSPSLGGHCAIFTRSSCRLLMRSGVTEIFGRWRCLCTS